MEADNISSTREAQAEKREINHEYLHRKAFQGVVDRRLKDKKENDVFDFPAYDYLHILSLTGYEYELNKLQEELPKKLPYELRETPLDEMPEHMRGIISEELRTVRGILKDYCQAIHCYEYFLQLPETTRKNADPPLPRIPEFSRYCTFRSRLKISSDLQSLLSDPRLLWSYLRRRKLITPNAEEEAAPASHDDNFYWHRSGRPDRGGRFLLGILAGAVLIAPMVIMIYRPSLTKSVLTVSITTILFAVAISFKREEDVQDKDILQAATALAAVLVVFIGTSSSG